MLTIGSHMISDPAPRTEIHFGTGSCPYWSRNIFLATAESANVILLVT